jgi:coenzyme PQQ precursor peptide PqqA
VNFLAHRMQAASIHHRQQEWLMSWTKPEFEVVEVTMEVTAYVARR